MGKTNNSKGSTDLLAQAMKRVFKEAVEEGVIPLGERMGNLENKVDTLQDNMQDQFAEQPRLISQEVHKIFERKSGK